MTARSALKIDILVDSKQWKDPQRVKSAVRRAVTQAAAATRSTRGTELAIVLTDDSAIRVLNRNWRGIDKATNVLSFPAKNGSAAPHLGDIVLAFETIEREATDEHKPLAHHVAHLAVHGFLHLLGYDHEHDKDARVMEQAERDILRQLKIPDPYGAQAVATKTSIKKASAKKTGAQKTSTKKAAAQMICAKRAQKSPRQKS
jgi:probable rRNA maturation factor